MPESPQFPEIMENATGMKVDADKAYSSVKNRQSLEALGTEDGIMHKVQQKRPSTDEQKENNAEISKIRWIVEQLYCTLNRRFNASRGRYLGIDAV